MPLEPLTPERRRAMTRQHLLDAAAVVFARDGFHGASIDEVAATAGFTKGAVYSNFKNKDDLFLELLDDRLGRQFALVESILEDAPNIERDVEMKRMADFVWRAMNNDEWTLLYLEFLVYAARNPDAKAKLAESARQSRQFVVDMRNNEFPGDDPPFDAAEFATVSLALFNGLGIDHLIDPDAVTKDTLNGALSLLYQFVPPTPKSSDNGPPTPPRRPEPPPLPKRRS
jgi:AcrR family transcriptional regulator